MTTCSDSPDGKHDFQVLQSTWQTVNYAAYQILNHSKQNLACKRCGFVLDAFPEQKINAAI